MQSLILAAACAASYTASMQQIETHGMPEGDDHHRYLASSYGSSYGATSYYSSSEEADHDDQVSRWFAIPFRRFSDSASP